MAIARAIVTDPDLILTDEPTGDLDAASAQDVLNLLSRLNKEFHKTIVMVTHDPHAARFASKARHLEKGELLPEGQVPADWALPAQPKTGSRVRGCRHHNIDCDDSIHLQQEYAEVLLPIRRRGC